MRFDLYNVHVRLGTVPKAVYSDIACVDRTAEVENLPTDGTVHVRLILDSPCPLINGGEKSIQISARCRLDSTFSKSIPEQEANTLQLIRFFEVDSAGSRPTEMRKTLLA